MTENWRRHRWQVPALRFLYRITLKRDWAPDAIAPPKRPATLPVVLSPEEVVHFLNCVTDRKHRVILTSCYAAGLRPAEALHLKIEDIDSHRMMVHVANGKGHHDGTSCFGTTTRHRASTRSYWTGIPA
jgi:site-specific recombinase XerD